jgi:hypothetical protein
MLRVRLRKQMRQLSVEVPEADTTGSQNLMPHNPKIDWKSCDEIRLASLEGSRDSVGEYGKGSLSPGTKPTGQIKLDD